ncbi:MAG: hypothetical protein Q8O40_14255 [Chloroflexota bacterium]|nr:hypothetical protein [Chloroflexota bacterium]
MTAATYSRKVSSEEARVGYILVLKNRLAFFGGVGVNFTLVQGGAAVVVKVEAYDCTCVGPEKPHQHYFIRWPGLKAGDRVEIEKASEDRYVLGVVASERARRQA